MANPKRGPYNRRERAPPPTLQEIADSVKPVVMALTKLQFMSVKGYVKPVRKQASKFKSAGLFTMTRNKMGRLNISKEDLKASFDGLVQLLENGVENTLALLQLDNQTEGIFKNILVASGWLKEEVVQVQPSPASPPMSAPPSAEPIANDDIEEQRLAGLRAEGYGGNIVTLGSGTYGKVYKATNVASGQQEAIKVMAYRTQNERHEFEQEVDIMKSLGAVNPFVLPIIRSWEKNGLAFIVLPLMKCTVWQYLCQYGIIYPGETNPTALNEDRIRIGIRQLMDAIDYLHGHDVCHRDFKGNNVLLDAFGNFILSDFGAALKCKPYEASSDQFGTLRFAPPEIYTRAESIPAMQDYYGLGTFLYTLLGCGAGPFIGFDQRAGFRVVSTDAPQRHKEIVTDCETLAVVSQQRNEALRFPLKMATNFATACALIEHILHWNVKERANRSDILSSAWLALVPLIHRGANGPIVKQAPTAAGALSARRRAGLMPAPRLTGYPHLR